MANTTVTPSNAELIRQLRASYIAPEQKNQLEALVPSMNEDEKAELLNLINRSHEEYKKASKAYVETLDNLGKDYQRTLKREDGTFRRELEGIDQKELIPIIEALIAETQTVPMGPAQSSKRSANSHRGHGLRNLILILLILGLAAYGVLYALNNLF